MRSYEKRASKRLIAEREIGRGRAEVQRNEYRRLRGALPMLQDSRRVVMLLARCYFHSIRLGPGVGACIGTIQAPGSLRVPGPLLQLTQLDRKSAAQKLGTAVLRHCVG